MWLALIVVLWLPCCALMYHNSVRIYNASIACPRFRILSLSRLRALVSASSTMSSSEELPPIELRWDLLENTTYRAHRHIILHSSLLISDSKRTQSRMHRKATPLPSACHRSLTTIGRTTTGTMTIASPLFHSRTRMNLSAMERRSACAQAGSSVRSCRRLGSHRQSCILRRSHTK